MDPQAYLTLAQTEDNHWWYRARRQILATMIARLRLPPQARILEVGSGTGGNLAMLSRFGAVGAVEMDATARALTAQKYGDTFDIRAGHFPDDNPFAGERFDLICLFDVLEHIEEDVATLATVREMLAEGGKILLTVPAYQWMWSVHDETLHHQRRYGSHELRAKGESAGLTVERLTHFNSLLFPLAALMRLKDRLSGNTTASGIETPAGPFNALLQRVFATERHLLPYFSLPFGVSLLAVMGRQ